MSAKFLDVGPEARSDAVRAEWFTRSAVWLSLVSSLSGPHAPDMKMVAVSLQFPSSYLALVFESSGEEKAILVLTGLRSKCGRKWESLVWRLITRYLRKLEEFRIQPRFIGEHHAPGDN